MLSAKPEKDSAIDTPNRPQGGGGVVLLFPISGLSTVRRVLAAPPKFEPNTPYRNFKYIMLSRRKAC